MSGDNIARSLALWTNKPQSWRVLCKKMSYETFINLQLLRFTHVESETGRGECNSEFKT